MSRDGSVGHRDGVLLVHATWIDSDAWFWECTRCECAFGPLVTHDAAERQADEHIREHHPATTNVTGPAVTRPAGPGATNPTGDTR